MDRFLRCAAVAAVAILTTGMNVSQSRGASYSWNAVFGPSTWSTASNWNPSGPPGGGDYAFIVNGGTATVPLLVAATCGTLSLGGQASGSLRLDAGGSLSDANEYVGATGTGLLSQSGGVSFVSNDLSVGDSLGGSGTYSLSGGSLQNGVGMLFNNMGAFSLGNSGNGTFIQSGGTVNLQGQGMFAGNSLFERGDYTLSGGLLTTAAFAAVSLGNGGSGSFTQSGGANVAPAIYIGGSSGGSYSLSGSGLLTSANETVGRDARGDFTQSGGTNDVTTLYMGLNADGTGSYSLGGGSLAAGFEFLGYGGAATFSQSGGNHTVSSELDVGYYPGSSGTCSLSGGTLAVSGNLNVGNSGSGTFLQTGGSVNVTGNSGLYLGMAAGSSGSYSLGAGLFAAPAEFINYNGGGSFTFAQSGGVNSVTNDLYLGYLNGSSGSYSLSGGSLAVLASEHVGQSGIGSFTQSGGTNTISTNLDLGFSAGGSGTYSLVGGSLAAANNERVGDSGYGSFIQSGGSNTTAALYLGYGAPSGSGASGSYALSAGLLTAGTISVGGPSPLIQGSVFTQSGGSVTTTQLLNLGTFSYSGGTFNGQLVNNGTCLFSSTFYAPGGIMNNSGGTAFTVPAGIVVGTSSGANTLDNEGTVTLAGGTLAGGQSAGGGAIVNNGLISGYGGLSSGVGIINNAQIIQNGGNLTISAGTAGMANNGTISAPEGYQLRLSSGTLSNAGTVNLNSSTIAGSGLLNNLSGNVVGPGTITAPFQNSGGVLTVPSGSTNITQPFANSAVIELAATDAQLTGGSIANSGIIHGYGTVANDVNNTGTIESNEGTLTFSGSLQNPAGGLIQPDGGSEIKVLSGLAANYGLINLCGGTFGNNSHDMTNYAQLSGYGELRTSGLTNQSNVTLSGGSSSVNGAVTNASGGTMQIEYNQALFTDAVVNNGLVNVTSATATFNGGFTNYGAYISDPAANYFSSLAIGPSGLLQGGTGDEFFVTGPLLTNSGHIDLGGTSQMVVDNGGGTLTQTGGTLELGTGAALSAGTVQINGGVLVADGRAAAITASLVYASSARSTYEGVLAGAGNSLTVDNHLTKLVLSGTDNTYGGGTIVEAGESWSRIRLARFSAAPASSLARTPRRSSLKSCPTRQAERTPCRNRRP